MEVAGIVARAALGLVFIWAGISKVRTAHWSMLAIEAGTPRSIVVALPAIEGLLGLALVVQLLPGIFSWVALALLAAFTATLTARYAKGSKAPCNCFGGKSNDPVDATTFIRNGALMLLALFGALA